MKKHNFPILFRLLYKLETTVGLILIVFFCMSFYAEISNFNNYKAFKNDYLKRITLGKMKVTYFKGASARSSGRSLSGYVIGNNSPLNCPDCVNIYIGSSSTNYNGSEYYDAKYIKKDVGDTVLVWYTNDFKYTQIVPKTSKNDLIEFEYLIITNFTESVLKVNLFILILFIVMRYFRKYFQKKYSISKEEYNQYKRIAYEK